MKKIIFACILFWTVFNILTVFADKYEESRKNMLDSQVRSRGIKNETVLRAIGKVPRHLFVPLIYRYQAYDDHPVPIGYGQTISQPYIVAYMTELLKPQSGHRVLEIGTGSGYQAAILAEIVKEVYTVEIISKLAKQAAQTLKEQGYKNIMVLNADGYYGWKEYAPFDSIIVTAAAEFVPPLLIKQLKTGGIMCIPVGLPFFVQTLYVIHKKSETEIESEVIAQVQFVPLTHKE